jgi:hypothetical protein
MTLQIDFKNINKLLISTIAIAILLGISCYRSPKVLDLMGKNIKFITHLTQNDWHFD